MTTSASAASPAPPQVLLAHHLRQLKLLTFLREYEKLAVDAAREGLDHVRFLSGFTVSFTTAAGLVHQLMEARDEKRLLKLQAQLAAVKLFIIDELGYVPLSQTGAELLFKIFSQRHERGSTIVTSYLPFEEWICVFQSQRLTGALPHRLTHHVHFLELNASAG